MLALDFDGVVCDALVECGAVTWHAARAAATGEIPDLATAVSQVPHEFGPTFASVRAYSRTLDDFMVANAVPVGQVVDRGLFDHYRAVAGSQQLSSEAAAGERIRAHWRRASFGEWIGLHTIYPEVADLISQTEHSVAIVSAKDADSIWAVLTYWQLADRIRTVIGSCRDKRPALADLAAMEAGGEPRAEPVIFIDDNLDNAIAAAYLPNIESAWATWGYHGPGEADMAADLYFPTISLGQLHDLTRIPVRPSATR